MKDATEKLEAWKDEYNNFRPHSSLEGMVPNEVVKKFKTTRKL